MTMLFFLIGMATFAEARPVKLPYNNYSCASIAVTVLNGEVRGEDSKTAVVGFVLTPESPEYIYLNTGMVEFQHQVEGHSIYMAAYAGIGQYSYEPTDPPYSQASYFQLSASLSDPGFEIVKEWGFEVPLAELPAKFVIRNPRLLWLRPDLAVLTRLECGYRETVDR